MIELDDSFYSRLLSIDPFRAVSLKDGVKGFTLRALRIFRNLPGFHILVGAEARISKYFPISDCGSTLDFPGASYATRIAAPAHFKGSVNTCYLLPRRK
jgi:hypothetical protein